MKVILLFDLAEPAKPDDDFSCDLGDESWSSEADVARSLRRLGHEVRLLGLCDDIGPLLELIRRDKPDLVFNLCEAFRRDRAHEADVAALLELLGVRYTGADPGALRLCKDKALAKQLVASSGVRTARSEVWRRGEPGEPALEGLRFPVLVKPLGLESSQGIARSSRATTRRAAVARARFVHEKLGQDALIEEYVEGRELHVAALAGELFPPRETVFGRGAARFLTYRAKWDDDYRRRSRIRTGPARKIESGERRSLDEACARVCRALGLEGYARIDLRLTSDGEPVFLEANPNPAIGSRDDFALAAARAGVSYDRLIERILQLA